MTDEKKKAAQYAASGVEASKRKLKKLRKEAEESPIHLNAKVAVDKAEDFNIKYNVSERMRAEWEFMTPEQKKATGYQRKPKHGVKVAIMCIVREENDYLEEWLMYHFNAGIEANKIFIGDNGPNEPGWQHPRDLELVRKLEAEGLVEVIDVTPPQDPGLQVRFYNEVYLKERYNFDWFIGLDVDEFLFLPHGGIFKGSKRKKQKSKITEYEGMVEYKGLKTLRAFLNLPYFTDTDVIKINWNCITDSGHIERPNYGKNIWQKVLYTYREELHKKNPELSYLDRECKCFVRGSKLMRWESAHNIEKKYVEKARNANGICIGKDMKYLTDIPVYDNIYIRHFITKSLQEFCERKLKRASYDEIVTSKARVNINQYFAYNEMTNEKLEWLKKNYPELYQQVDFDNAWRKKVVREQVSIDSQDKRNARKEEADAKIEEKRKKEKTSLSEKIHKSMQ